MKQVEMLLVAFFLACWIVGLLSWIDWVDLAGALDLGLYPYFSIAAFLGWLAGNVYVHRARRLVGIPRVQNLVLYFLGPLGLVYLLRGMAPLASQAAAPFVPLYAFGVFSVFFLVPVSLRPNARAQLDLSRRPPRDSPR